jgi:hypothetical protein
MAGSNGQSFWVSVLDYTNAELDPARGDDGSRTLGWRGKLHCKGSPFMEDYRFLFVIVTTLFVVITCQA